jgi:hypothetical protein
MKVVRLSVGMLGLAALCAALWLWHAGEQTKAWPSVVGHADSAYVASLGSGPIDTVNVAPVNLPVVTYFYQVDGQRHTGTRLAIWDLPYKTLGGGRAALERVTADPMQVFYDPNKPSESVLIVGPPVGAITQFSVAALALLALAIFLPAFSRWFLKVGLLGS